MSDTCTLFCCIIGVYSIEGLLNITRWMSTTVSVYMSGLKCMIVCLSLSVGCHQEAIRLFGVCVRVP